MILALLLAAAEPQTAIDAERAFAADAQKLGQWTAFRKYAADDAVMFVPNKVNAQAFLKELKDPPTAVFWWPGKSFVSCDGNYAVNTGPWVRQWGKAVGYFTTVWQKQTDGSWKWIYDGGETLETARAEGGDIKPQPASCEGKPAGLAGASRSNDGSIAWEINVATDGARSFRAYVWNGKEYQKVVEDLAAAPK